MICTNTDHFVNTLSTIKKRKKKKKKKRIEITKRVTSYIKTNHAMKNSVSTWQ